MKMIGYTELPLLLRGLGEPATVYMLSTSNRNFSDGIQWTHYQIMVQIESGENVLYWLLDLGSEPTVFGERTRESRSTLAASADRAIKEYLKVRWDITPHPALISYPRDIVLTGGSTEEFLRYDKEKNSFEVL